VAISAITLAELSAGPHEVRRNEEQSDHDEHAERGRRLGCLLTVVPVTRSAVLHDR
jgi:predicted nucleic acid-binding protein